MQSDVPKEFEKLTPQEWELIRKAEKHGLKAESLAYSIIEKKRIRGTWEDKKHLAEFFIKQNEAKITTLETKLRMEFENLT